MVIDIIGYTEEQYAALSTGKLQKILSAQAKKNALLKKLQERLLKEKQRLIDRGIYTSNIYSKLETELTEACDAEITAIRDALTFYLRYVADGKSQDKKPEGVPYEVDYSLSEEERMAVVRAYYERAYSDTTARFNAFVADTFAKSYLGEMYAPLYHYFAA